MSSYWDCVNTACVEEHGCTMETKGRDRVCSVCGYVKQGYRSHAELGWKRVRLNMKLVWTYNLTRDPRRKFMKWAGKPIGFVNPDNDHLAILWMPTLLGRAFLFLLIPFYILLEGLPTFIRYFKSEFLFPVKYGSRSIDDVFKRGCFDDKDWNELFK